MPSKNRLLSCEIVPSASSSFSTPSILAIASPLFFAFEKA